MHDSKTLLQEGKVMKEEPLFSERLTLLPPYLFVEIDRIRDEVKKQGRPIIDLSVGDPDLSPPAYIIDKLTEALREPSNHKYPSYTGLLALREAVVHWYRRRFGISLDPAKEVIALIGSKEGIAHIPLAFVNPGDTVLIPEPAYPVYNAATVMAGGIPHFMPLLPKNGFLPDLSAVPERTLQKARLMFLNYPNNPTSAVAEVDFFKQVVKVCSRYNIIVCHDAAYSEVNFGEFQPPSFLEVEGAKEIGVEFHSLSKTYNITGWRIGFAVGNSNIIKGLGAVKSNIDSGIFQPIQYAGIEALTRGDDYIAQTRETYKKRRDAFISGLARIGIKAHKPLATFYVWMETPGGMSSAEFTKLLLRKTSVVITPGSGFGSHGEGFVRMAMTVSAEKLTEAVERIRKVQKEWS